MGNTLFLLQNATFLITYWCWHFHQSLSLTHPLTLSLSLFLSRFFLFIIFLHNFKKTSYDGIKTCLLLLLFFIVVECSIYLFILFFLIFLAQQKIPRLFLFVV